MGIFSDLLGTLRSTFQLGIGGVKLKNSSGNLLVRNSGDSADAAVTASNVNVSGNSLTLNSAATESGASWKMNLARPSSGMTADQTITLPAGNGTAGYAVVTDGAGNWSYAAAASTASCDKIDTTTIAFGSTSPVAMFSTGASDIVDEVEVIIDTPFSGGTTPSLSIGISGTTSKYMAATDIDLTAAAGTVFKVHPGLAAQGAEALIATYAANSSTAGSARVLVHFSTPQ